MWLIVSLACAPKHPLGVVHEASAIDAFRSPSDAYGWFLRARVAEASGDRAEADRGFAWMTRLDRPTAGMWVAAGDYASRSRRPDDALEAYLKALALEPSSPPAQAGAARAWLALGDEREASVYVGQIQDRATALELRLQVAWQRGASAEAHDTLAQWGTLSVEPSVQISRSQWALRLGEPQLALTDALDLLGHPTHGPAAARLVGEAASRLGVCVDRVTDVEHLGLHGILEDECGL